MADLAEADMAAELPVFVTEQIRSGNTRVVTDAVETISKNRPLFQAKLERLVHEEVVEMKEADRKAFYDMVQNIPRPVCIRIFSQPYSTSPHADNHWKRPCLQCYDNSLQRYEYPSLQAARQVLVIWFQEMFHKCTNGFVACYGFDSCHAKCDTKHEWKVEDIPLSTEIKRMDIYHYDRYVVEWNYETSPPINFWPSNDRHKDHESYMQVDVQFPSGETKGFDLPSGETTVGDLKQLIKIQDRLLPDQYQLVRKNRTFKDSDDFDGYAYTGITLQLVMLS